MSLLSLHLAQDAGAGNLGGPIGGALAHALSWTLGFAAYPLIALVVLMGARMWASVEWPDLAREASAGVLVVTALATALGLYWPNDAAVAGIVGAQIAELLRGSLNIGGGYLAVGFTLIAGVALMLKRAPTELA